MSPVKIVPASRAHVCRIAHRMRPDDRLECTAMGYSPKQGLRAALAQSSEAWTALVDGEPHAMFGLVVSNALCGIGRPWMLGSDEIYRHPRQMLKGGKLLLAHWLDSITEMRGLVSLGNDRAIRMLRKWGCELESEVILMTGVEFVAFTLER